MLHTRTAILAPDTNHQFKNFITLVIPSPNSLCWVIKLNTKNPSRGKS